MKKLATLITIFVAVISLVLPTPQASAYTDVTSAHKYSEAITFITEKGIVAGYPDFTYKPERELKRAELLKILIQAKHGDISEELEQFSGEKCFTDIQTYEWYTKYVCFAKNEKIISGYKDGTFRPSKSINLSEALKITLKTFAYEYPSGQDPWYKGIIEKASEENFISPDFVAPYQNVNRGQMSDIITRVLKSQNGELDEYLENQNQIYATLAGATGVTEFKLEVPFSAQAPYGDWSPPFDEACEETSLLMVKYFLEGQNLDKETAKSEIISMVEFENEINFGIDIGTLQMKKIIEDYFELNSEIFSGEDVSIESIEALLTGGYPVIIPVAGQKIGNTHFSGDGPPYHVLVITGFDETNFITNDPGTSYGENYEYNKEILYNAIHDWTGSRSTIEEGEKSILILTN